MIHTITLACEINYYVINEQSFLKQIYTIPHLDESKKGNVKAIKELRNLIGEDKPDADAEFTKVDELIASIDRMAQS